jgi:hypothetical protein
MGSLTDYFEKTHTYRPVYEIGDRVFGHYQQVPFVGSVGNDRVVSESGPEVTVHLDLPLKTSSGIHNIVVVKHKNIKRLINHDTEDTGILRKNTRSQRRV